MKRAAIGVRVHSGWAAVVAVSGKPGSVQVLDRRRIVIAGSQGALANQPYHFAAKLELLEAEQHLTGCAAASERLAVAALEAVKQFLNGRGYEVAGAAVLLASGRTLPPLPSILASHALIHTAEGVFFRQAICQAFEHLGIHVLGIRERELGGSSNLQSEIASLGKIAGPPWTQDQKTAALAAMAILSG